MDRSALTSYPEYTDESDGSDMNGDFGLIELPESISAMAAIHCPNSVCATPVCLPQGAPPAGKACWHGGFGLQDYDDNYRLKIIIKYNLLM